MNISQACRLHSRRGPLCRAAEAKVPARSDSQARRRLGERGSESRTGYAPALPGRFRRIWIERRSPGIAARRFDLLQNLDDANSAFNGIVEMKSEMGCVFHSDATGQLSLQCGSLRFEFINHARTGFRSKNTDKDVCIFQISGHVDLIDGDESTFECNLARDDSAELAF